MFQMFENIDTSWIGTTVSTAAGAFFGWLFGRRKQKAEAQSSELENVEKAVAIWRQIASDLEGKFTALQTEVNQLRKEVLKLEMENERLKDANRELQLEIDELRTQIKS